MHKAAVTTASQNGSRKFPDAKAVMLRPEGMNWVGNEKVAEPITGIFTPSTPAIDIMTSKPAMKAINAYNGGKC